VPNDWRHTTTIAVAEREIEFLPLPAPFGAEVRGVDLTEELAEPVADAIRDAFDLYDVLVFPDQPLSPEDEIRTLKIFHPDIAEADNGWGLNLPGHPEILLLSNVVEPGEPIGFHNKIGMGWHIDGVGWDPATYVSSLFCVELPTTGSVTWFASSTLAYDLLPEETKQRIEERTAHYDFISSQRWLAANSTGYMDPIPDSEIPNYPPVEVPIVLTHPRTGRKSLFFNGSDVVHPDRSPDPESKALLKELLEHVTTNPHNRVAIPWAPNQLVCWNNRTMFHSAPEYDAEGQRRVFHQMTGRGPDIPLPD
jgi:taurine dioxygenase